MDFCSRAYDFTSFALNFPCHQIIKCPMKPAIFSLPTNLLGYNYLSCYPHKRFDYIVYGPTHFLTMPFLNYFPVTMCLLSGQTFLSNTRSIYCDVYNDHKFYSFDTILKRIFFYNSLD